MADLDVDRLGWEGDDGGVYRRPKPALNTENWASINGDIQTTEFHDAAWDANSDIIIGGAQDTGSPQQQASNSTTWVSVLTADGGDVAVDDTGSPGLSVRYVSFQNLGAFSRRVYDATNILVSTTFISLNPLPGSNPIVPQFTTPIKLNNVNPNRIILGGSNSVYESFNQGDSNAEIGVGIRVNIFGQEPIACGATSNPDMLYIGAGANVFVRNAAPPAALAISAAYPGTGSVVDIAIDPAVANTAFVVDGANAFRTVDGGVSWVDISGNLAALNPGTIRCLAYRGGSSPAVVVGTDTGVFIASDPAFNNWAPFGTGLPTVPIYDLEYDVVDTIFVAATLGRGAWILDE